MKLFYPETPLKWAMTGMLQTKIILILGKIGAFEKYWLTYTFQAVVGYFLGGEKPGQCPVSDIATTCDCPTNQMACYNDFQCPFGNDHVICTLYIREKYNSELMWKMLM